MTSGKDSQIVNEIWSDGYNLNNPLKHDGLVVDDDIVDRYVD